MRPLDCDEERRRHHYALTIISGQRVRRSGRWPQESMQGLRFEVASAETSDPDKATIDSDQTAGTKGSMPKEPQQ
jgi:hypothetical protein